MSSHLIGGSRARARIPPARSKLELSLL